MRIMLEVIRNFIENPSLYLFIIIKDYLINTIGNIIMMFGVMITSYSLEFWIVFFGVFLIISIIIWILHRFLFSEI